MAIDYYSGLPGARRAASGLDVFRNRRRPTDDPGDYIADPELAHAVNIALLLGQPLLLTGEPGTGKTQLAYSVARELGLKDEPLKFETKSTSTGTELFYTYNALARFQARPADRDALRPADYITYNALGLAIIRSRREEEVMSILPRGFVHGGPRGSVVLIDEVDKAPRDFPNDILNEVERLYFRIPELNNAVVRADRDLGPVIVITSNSEKNLPDAFLRRCVYHHIVFPGPIQLRKIAVRRLRDHLAADDPLIDEAIDLFFTLREKAGLQKKPATAELLGWLLALAAQSAPPRPPLAATSELITGTLGLLIKTQDDLAQARKMIPSWIAKTQSPTTR